MGKLQNALGGLARARETAEASGARLLSDEEIARVGRFLRANKHLSVEGVMRAALADATGGHLTLETLAPFDAGCLRVLAGCTARPSN